MVAKSATLNAPLAHVLADHFLQRTVFETVHGTPTSDEGSANLGSMDMPKMSFKAVWRSRLVVGIAVGGSRKVGEVCTSPISACIVATTRDRL